MALTLRSAITANQSPIDILGPEDISDGEVYSIGSEYVLVNGDPFVPHLATGEVSYQRATVIRGIQGTPKAAHAANATLTNVLPGGGGGGGVTVTGSQSGSVAGATTVKVAGAVTDLGGGVAAQGLVLQLITVDVAYNDPNVLTGRVIYSMPINAWLYDAAARVTTAFTGADNANLDVTTPFLGQYFHSSGLTFYTPSTHDDDNGVQTTAVLNGIPPIYAKGAFDVSAALDVTNGPLTAGVVRVYLFVLAPAS